MKLETEKSISKTKKLLTGAGLQDTCWGKRILKAKNRGKFNKQDRAMAVSWATCACGKVTADIKRNVLGEPRDHVLSSLGCIFASKVTRGQFRKSAETLIAIEKRSLEIEANEN